MKGFLNKLVFIVGISSISSAYAVPNFWSTETGQGFLVHQISNSKNQGFFISCNEGAGEDYDHSVHYQPNINEDTTFDLSQGNYSLLINNALATTIPESTSYRLGAADWIEFADEMEKSTNIQIYDNNQLIATFEPKNTRRELDGFSEYCNPLFYKEW